MIGPRNNSTLPLLSYARVVSYDTPNHAVFVSLPSLQTISVSAKILIQGSADVVRINQDPLPVIGTIGLVAFPFGDTRSAIWLGAFYPSVLNAVTTSNPPTDQDSQMKYFAHASGEWSLLDYIGNYFNYRADGTTIAINSNNSKPTVYRHGSDSDAGFQTLVPFTDPRNVVLPSPFYVSINHPSGASATITPSGTVTITAGNPQHSSITMTPSGVITINGGNPTSGNQASPQVILDSQVGTVSIYSENQKGIITMDSTGTIMIKSAGSGTISVIATGSINIQSSGSNVFLNTATHTDSVDNIILTYNSHTHPDPQGGNTGVPTQQLT